MHAERVAGTDEAGDRAVTKPAKDDIRALRGSIAAGCRAELRAYLLGSPQDEWEDGGTNGQDWKGKHVEEECLRAMAIIDKALEKFEALR